MPERVLKNCFHLFDGDEAHKYDVPADNTFAAEQVPGKGGSYRAMDAAEPHNMRYKIAVLARRSARMRRIIGNALKNAGIDAYIGEYDGEDCDILAAFDTGPSITRITPPKGCVPIIYSGSSRARNALSGCELPCVTCGTAVYDTVTVSSLSAGRAMLTVQRELTPLCGGVIEPCELPLSYKGCDIYKALLCASAVLMCAGLPVDGHIMLSPRM